MMWKDIQKFTNKKRGINPAKDKFFLECMDIVTQVKTDPNVSKEDQPKAIIDLVRKRLASESRPKNADSLLEEFAYINLLPRKDVSQTTIEKQNLAALSDVQDAVGYIINHPLEVELKDYQDVCEQMLSYLNKKLNKNDNDPQIAEQIKRIEDWCDILNDESKSVAGRILEFKQFAENKENLDLISQEPSSMLKRGLRSTASSLKVLPSFAGSNHTLFKQISPHVLGNSPILDDIEKSKLPFHEALKNDLLLSRRHFRKKTLLALYQCHKILVDARKDNLDGFELVAKVADVICRQHKLFVVDDVNTFRNSFSNLKLPPELHSSQSAADLKILNNATMLVLAEMKHPNLAKLPRPLNQKMIDELAVLEEEDCNLSVDALEGLALIYNTYAKIERRLVDKYGMDWAGDELAPEAIDCLKQECDITTKEQAQELYDKLEQLELPEAIARSQGGYLLVTLAGACATIKHELSSSPPAPR